MKFNPAEKLNLNKKYKTMLSVAYNIQNRKITSKDFLNRTNKIKTLLNIEESLPHQEEAYSRVVWKLKDGSEHREFGPAIVYSNGLKLWFSYGVKHKEDGPAVVRPDGTVEYWLYGQQLTEKEFLAFQLLRNYI